MVLLAYVRINNHSIHFTPDLFPRVIPQTILPPILLPTSTSTSPGLGDPAATSKPATDVHPSTPTLNPSTELPALEAHLRELDLGEYTDLIRPASIAIPLFSKEDNPLALTPGDKPFRFTFPTKKLAVKRRGKRTARLRDKTEERALECIDFLAEQGRRACAHDDERQEIIRTSRPDTLLHSLIEHARICTSRASATPESLAALTRSPAVADALRAYAKSPWTFNPADYPDAFVRVYEEDLQSLDLVQQYYFRRFRYSVEMLLEHIATYSDEFCADADRFAVLVRVLADLTKTIQVCLTYVGTTYASTPAGRHSNDAAAAANIYTRIANWMKLFPADSVEIWKLYPLDQRLEGSSEWSSMQLHRQNNVAIDLEELLVDLGGGYLLNSAFGGTGSFKFSPARMSPEERATESLVCFFFSFTNLYCLTPLHTYRFRKSFQFPSPYPHLPHQHWPFVKMSKS